VNVGWISTSSRIPSTVAASAPSASSRLTLAFLGEVDEFEVSSERPSDDVLLVGRETVERVVDRLAGLCLAPPVADRGVADRFDEVERLVRALVFDNVPQQLTQFTHVLVNFSGVQSHTTP
jgi:hypothetical protein